jgi:hypothetical protein
MHFGTDGKGQLYVEWDVGAGGLKRAWIQRREGDKDWANVERYLNVVRIDRLDSGPAGNATDFPIYSSLSDKQVLRNFVIAVASVTALDLPVD